MQLDDGNHDSPRPLRVKLLQYRFESKLDGLTEIRVYEKSFGGASMVPWGKDEEGVPVRIGTLAHLFRLQLRGRQSPRLALFDVHDPVKGCSWLRLQSKRVNDGGTGKVVAML